MQENYPRHVLRAFEGFRDCGIIRHGAMRIKCRHCDHNKLIALSCKRRGFCTSCAQKFMLETSRHLLDNILPEATYRQIVVTLPFTIRLITATNSEILSRINQIITRAILRNLKSKALQKGLRNPAVGCINFIQKFGGQLNANPHWHCLVIEKAFEENANSESVQGFNLPPMSETDLAEILQEIIAYVAKYFRKAGYADHADQMVKAPPMDSIFEKHPPLPEDLIKSVLLPKDHELWTDDHASMSQNPPHRGRLCLGSGGFTIHGATKVNPMDRPALERLVNYMGRPALSAKSVSLAGDTVTYQLKRPLKSGATSIKMPLDRFIRRLASLIPLPKKHLVRHHGIFARAHPLRPKIIKNPGVLKTFTGKLPNPETGRKLVANTSWADLLRRSFKIDISICSDCGGPMEVMAVIYDGFEIDRFNSWLTQRVTGPPTAPSPA